jgi:hypothetical protein
MDAGEAQSHSDRIVIYLIVEATFYATCTRRAYLEYKVSCFRNQGKLPLFLARVL